MSLADYLADPRVRAFLDTIGIAERADYHTRGGGGAFNQDIADLSRYPYQNRGAANTASGKYQIVRKTWLGVQRALGLSDFSPASQDLAGLYLLQTTGALSEILVGNYDAAFRKGGSQWESLPGSLESVHPGIQAHSLSWLNGVLQSRLAIGGGDRDEAAQRGPDAGVAPRASAPPVPYKANPQIQQALILAVGSLLILAALVSFGGGS